MPSKLPGLSSDVTISEDDAIEDSVLQNMAAFYPNIDDIDLASMLIDRIIRQLFVKAGRPVDETLTSISSCLELLRVKPELHELLKLAHAEKDYTRVAESPLIPPFVSSTARAYLDSLRPHMEKLVNGEKTLDTWIPDSDVPVDDATLRHIESLKLCRLHRDGIHQRDFSIILHDLGGFKNDPVLNARTTEIFTRQNKFLVNTSGSGKTRLLYEGLCLNWGLFFAFVVDSGHLGAGDIQKALKDMFKTALGFHKTPAAPAADIMKQNSKYFSDIFSALLLARLLIFQVFLEVASASGLTEEHKKRWLMMQLSPELLNPRPDGVFGYSAFDVLPQILAREDTGYVRENIADALRKIRKLLGDASPFFIVLDEAQTAVTEFTEAFASTMPRPSLLTELMQVWGSHTTEDDTFIFAGTNIPKSLFEGVEDSGYVWCSGTGAFEPEAQERYVSSFLPPTFCTSPSGILLISRISRWLAGRHRWTASFIHALIREGFTAPHTRFNAYISNVTGFKPLDDFEKVQAQVKAEARDPEKSWRKIFTIVTFSEMPTGLDFRPLFLDILVRYMATHHGSPAFGPEYIRLVNEGYGRCTDAELSRILVDEPLILVGIARALLPDPRSRPAVEKHIPGHPNNYPETFVGSMRLNVPRTPGAFSHWLVFHLARLFGQPRNLADVFNFPHKAPAWANQSAQLATFHPTGTEPREFGYSIVSSDDASEERRPPLAFEAASLEETLSWLAHDTGTLFCLPRSSSTAPDLLFPLMLADGTSILVALRAMVSTDPVPDSELQAAVSQLRPKCLFIDEDDPTVHSRAIATLQDMPFRSPKLGKYGLLRVVSSFPAEIDLKGCVPKSCRDVASLSLTAFENEVTQPEFFNSVVNGILAGSKRKSEAAPESSSKRHKSVHAKAEELPAPEVPVSPKKKRAGKLRATSPQPPNATVTRRGGVNRKPEIPPEDVPAKGGKAKGVPSPSSTPVSRNTRSRTKAAEKRKGKA
ncbi:hypothetical protein C8R47DRAFT_1150038 [Mycena vitilis]|nr:hypothetical protein C8R47DRAFT_1150038 [Mycena vitilis]